MTRSGKHSQTRPRATRLSLAVTLLAAVSYPAVAQTTSANPKPPTTPAFNETADFPNTPVGQLAGKAVFGADGTDLGRIAYVVISSERPFVVIDVKDRRVALEPTKFAMRQGRISLIDIEQDDLRTLPDYSDGNSRRLADPVTIAQAAAAQTQ